MAKMTIYHNPRCSKSRGALQLLTDAGVELEVVAYLQNPLDAVELRALVAKLGVKPRDVVRSGEDVFQTLGLDLEDDAAVIAAIAEHPVLMERPIVVCGDRAVVGRPPENVTKLLE